MAASRRKRRPYLWIMGIPAALLAGVFGYFAEDNPLAAAGIGALIGAFIGIALMAFPDLDRGGPADTDSWFR
jgi:hypothetical protein